MKRQRKLNQKNALSMAMAMLNGLHANTIPMIALTPIVQELVKNSLGLVEWTEESTLKFLEGSVRIIEPLFFTTAYADTSINNGETQDVVSGQTVTSTTINSGGSQYVNNGGTAAVTTINSGGTQVVWTGGTATNTTLVSGGKQDVLGIAVSTTVAGGSQAVWGGTTVSTTISGGGTQSVWDGTAVSTTISSGTQVLESGTAAVSTTINSGGYQHVYGAAVATSINGGTQGVNGMVTSTTINSGGVQDVGNNGNSTNTIINSGGRQYVDNGGTAGNTTVNSGGMQVVWSGSTVGNAILNSGSEQDVVGTARDTAVSGGLQAVWGGNAINTVISSGLQNVWGHSTATNTTIYGGSQNIESGGTAVNTTILGGTQYVQSGGTAMNTGIASGGMEIVSTGANNSSATIQSGGTELIFGIDSATTVSGEQTVASGGIARAATVMNGGTQTIASSGYAAGTTVFGGAQIVQSGGTAVATTVTSGMQLVSSGAIVSNTTTTSGGTICLLSGAQLTGSTYLNSGEIVLGFSSGSCTIDDLSLLNNATVRLANGTTVGNQLAVANLSGSGNFVINTDVANNKADTITVNNVSGKINDTIQVKFDPAFSSGKGVNGNATFAIVSNGHAVFTAKPTECGAYTFTPVITETTTGSVTSWAVTSLVVGASETLYTGADVQGGIIALWRNESNNINRRMGELRNGGGQEGEWLRVYSGQDKLTDNYGRNYKETYTAIQGGYDTRNRVQNGTIFRGYAMGYLGGNVSLTTGDGNSSIATVGVYRSWLGDDGHFLDCIVKQGRLNNSYTSYLNNSSNTKVNGNYKMLGTSISAEYGYRKQMRNSWYLEPQAELILSHITGVDYITSDATAVHNQGINSLLGRLGMALGRNYGTGTLYIQTSVVREFRADSQVTMLTDGLPAVSLMQSFKDTWIEFAFGWTMELKKKTNSYFEVSKTTGKQVETPWQVNAGVRWSF